MRGLGLGVLVLVACGCSSSGGNGQSATTTAAACSACAPNTYVCGASGMESANLSVSLRSDAGCSGALQGSAVTIQCGAKRLCYAGQCGAFSDDGGVLNFSVQSSPVHCSPGSGAADASASSQ